jgi:ankyrin repeat protein
MRYQYGGANREKIFEKYKAKLINRLRNDRTAKINIDSLTTLPDEIFGADPTDNKQYIEWITNSYILGGINLYDDLSRTHSALVNYEYLRNSGKLEKNTDVKKDENIIANFCGLRGCNKRNKKLMGLDDLMDKYKDEFEKKELKEEEKSKAQKEGITVYDGETIRVIQPTTEASACYYGRGTRWCTATTESENMFERYNAKGPLYIIIPKNPAYEGEKYQIHFETYQYMNEKDEEIELKGLAELYPELSKFHLIFAIARNSVDDVRELLEKGANVHINNDYTLRWASRDGHLEIVKLLIEKGADVHAKDDEAIRIASEVGHLKIVQLLLENGADVHARSDYALCKASKNGHLEIVKLLMENGAKVNARDDYAFKVASEMGHFEIVQLLLENGAKVNAQHDSAFRLASRMGHFEIVKLLLENGAKVNAENDYALRYAIHNDHEGVVNLLLNYGADFSKVLPKIYDNYEKYAKIYNEEYFKREEKEGNLADWEDICRYLNQEYRLPQLKSIANKLNIGYDSKITKKDLCELISKDYDVWVKEENKDKDNIRMEIHKKKKK